MASRMEIKLTPASEVLLAKLAKAGKIDMRPTFEVIGIGYRKEVGAIFDKQQPRTEGERWKPLNAAYAIQKQKRWGPRGILVASGSLLASMTVKGAPGNITAIKKDQAVFGTSVPYGIYHDSDKPRKSKLPRRNFSEPSERRAKIWKGQIEKDVRHNFEVNGIKVSGAILQ